MGVMQLFSFFLTKDVTFAPYSLFWIFIVYIWRQR